MKKKLPTKSEQAAMELVKEPNSVVNQRLTQYIDDDFAFGLQVCKDLIEIAKSSVKGKGENQKEFLELCNTIIRTCDEALKDGQISEREQKRLLTTIDRTLKTADKSNRQYQKDKTAITHHAISVAGGVAAVLGTVALVGKIIVSTAIRK